MEGTLWLVGMMGAGKSTVGPALARRLARPFVDSDAEIERAAGRRVAEIFAEEGESGFRARERRAIEALAGTPAVVALGGGAVAQPGAGALLERSGVIVYLRTRPETLLFRLGDCRSRPLLADAAPEERRERLSALMAEREKHYAAAALVVDTDDVPIGAVVDRVLAALGGSEPEARR